MIINVTPTKQSLAICCLALLLCCLTGLAQGSYDYNSIDPVLIGYGSANDGIPRWNPETDTHFGGFLGKTWNSEWRNYAFEWIPGTNLVVYGSNLGLRLWNTETDSFAGYYNNATNGNWRVTGLALDPANKNRVIWTTRDGLKVWDTVSNKEIGRFNNTSDDWTSNPIANHPTNSSYVIYRSAAGTLRVWDTVVNAFVGPYGTNVVTNWTSDTDLTRLPAQKQTQDGIALRIGLQGASITLSWPATIGSSYRIMSGTRLWDFKDFGAEFNATNNPAVVTLGIRKSVEFYLIRPRPGL